MEDFFIQNGAWGLFILAFTEASFFPIPPDIVLLPLGLLSPARALYYAAITSIASTLGGIFGYFIGVRAGRPILSRFIKENNFHKIEEMFDRYGGWAVAVAGFTPIPYKVFTIASGVFHMDFTTFVIATVFSRSARFFLESAIILVMGDKAIMYIDRFMGSGSLILMVVIVLLYFLFKSSGLSLSFKLKKHTLTDFIKQKVKKFVSLYGEFGIYLVAGFSIVAIFGMFFLKLASEVFERELEWFDRGVIGYINNMNSVYLDGAVKLMDFLQQPPIFIVLIIIFLIYTKVFYKKNIYPIMTFFNFMGSIALQWGLKSLYKRPRVSPQVSLSDFFTYSFPSGLILLLTALLGYLLFLSMRKAKRTKKILITLLWIFLMLGVGISRVYADISYPSDVMAGFLLGVVWLVICIVATRGLEYYKI